MPKRTPTRALVEGALLAGITVVLVLLGTLLPLIGPLITFLWPVPVMLVQFRYGLKISLLTIFVAGFLLSSLLGPLQGALLVLTMGSVGILVGYGFRRDYPASTVIILASAGALFGFLATLGAFAVFFHENFLATMVATWDQAVAGAQIMVDRFGGDPEARQRLEETATQMRTFLPAILPAAVMVSAIGQALLNFVVAREVMSRLGHATRPLASFARWQLPAYTVYGYFAGFGALLAGTHYNLAPLKDVGNNLLFFFSILFFVQGLSVAYFFLHRAGLSRGLAGVILVFFATVPVLNQVAVWTGMIESVLGYRRRLETRSG